MEEDSGYGDSGTLESNCVLEIQRGVYTDAVWKDVEVVVVRTEYDGGGWPVKKEQPNEEEDKES